MPAAASLAPKPAAVKPKPSAPVAKPAGPKPAKPKSEPQSTIAKTSAPALPAFVRAGIVTSSSTPGIASISASKTSIQPSSEKAIHTTLATAPQKILPDRPITPTTPAAAHLIAATPGSKPAPAQATTETRTDAHAPQAVHAPAGATAPERAKATAIHTRPSPIPNTAESSSHALPPEVKSAIENSYSINLDGVEFHADSHAQAAAASFSARAFAYGKHIFLGRNEKLKDLQLIAHEAAHTVQQQGVPTVMRSAPGQSDPFEIEADRAAAAVMRGEKFAITGRVDKPRVQRWSPLKWVREHVSDAAYNIPGYRLLTVLIGRNPITGEDVDRSAANILRGMVELVPVVGHQIEQALDKYGVFDKIGNWLEKKIQEMFAVGRAIKQDWDDFVDDLGWTDIRHPIKVVEDALGVFERAIERIGKFIAGVVLDILEMLKQAILVPLAKLIKEKTSAWDLLTAVLGHDPITGEKVDDSPEAVIGGFMKLIHEDEVWENIKKANAISRAWNWFKSALKELLGFVTQIPSLFIDALKSLTIEDIILLPKAVLKVIKVFVGFGAKFFSWALQKVLNLLEIIFEVVAPGAMPYLRKVGAAISSIFKHPIQFVHHLVDAGKLGFHLFAEHFGTHLKNSFFDWLTKSLKGVYIPKSFDLREIVKFVLSVLGLTWENIRAKLVKVVGETAVKAMETGFDIVVTLVTQGPAAAWDKIVEQLSNLQDVVIKAIMDFVVVTVVKRAVAQIAAMLIPGGAFISAIIAIYDAIKVFIEKLAKIIEVAKAFLDSLIDIVSGKIAGAAKKVEDTLAGMLTLAISFLAGFLHLGSLADKVIEIIEKIRNPIDKALDKVVDWIVTMAKKTGKFVAAKVRKLFGWDSVKSTFRDSDGSSHSIYVSETGGAPQLIVASDPKAIREFLVYYSEQRGAKFTESNRSLISDIKASATKAEIIIVDINKLQKQNKDDPRIEGLLSNLLDQNVELSGLLANLIKDDRSIGKSKEKYKLEGLTGTYSSIPKPPGDDFTADHQPQAAILQAAAEFPYFQEMGDKSALAQRAKGRAKEGYAINLHKIRHEAGATYGSKGKGTKADFLVDIEKWTAGAKGGAAKRAIVVARIKKDMQRDVQAMRDVVKAKDDSANWSDIMTLKSGTETEKKELVGDVRGRILSGEREIEAQDIDSLVQ